MQAAFQDQLEARRARAHIRISRGVGWGLAGGLAATLAMDLLLMASLAAAGMEALSCFTIVGDTMAQLLGLFGVRAAGSIALGIGAHYLVGPLMGAGFGAAALRLCASARAGWLRVDGRQKAVLLAILYAEILSQPLLALAPLLLDMPANETLMWYGGSVGMHMIWGAVLGAIWSRGLRLQGRSQAAKQR